MEELPDAEDVSEESAEVQVAKTNEPESAPEEVKKQQSRSRQRCRIFPKRSS